MKITVIGSVFIDIKGHPYSEYMPDGRNAGYIEYVNGGVGRNIAEDLNSLGVSAAFASLVSPDAAGRDIVLKLGAAGVDTRFVRESENGHGTWLAVFNEKGDVVSSISARADLNPLKEVLDEDPEALFGDTDAILLEIDIDTPVVDAVFKYAARFNKPVYCAVATMSHALDKSSRLKNAELFICNIQEAEMLFERELSSLSREELVSELSKEICSFGLKAMIVTMSEKGSVFASSGGEAGYVPAISAELIDSTGAGDSYCAGAVASLVGGSTLREACLAGTAVASKVVASAENVYNGSPLDL